MFVVANFVQGANMGVIEVEDGEDDPYVEYREDSDARQKFVEPYPEPEP